MWVVIEPQASKYSIKARLEHLVKAHELESIVKASKKLDHSRIMLHIWSSRDTWELPDVKFQYGWYPIEVHPNANGVLLTREVKMNPIRMSDFLEAMKKAKIRVKS